MKFAKVLLKNVSPKNYHRVVPFNEPLSLGYGLYITYTNEDGMEIEKSFEIDSDSYSEIHLMLFRMTGIMPSLGCLTSKDLTVPVLNQDMSIILKPVKEEKMIYISIMDNDAVEVKEEYIVSTNLEKDPYRPIVQYDSIIIK